MAPEMISGTDTFATEYTGKIDVYSFAIILYELITERAPYGELGINATLRLGLSVIRGRRPSEKFLPSTAPHLLCELMRQCWSQEPDARPDLSSCVNKLQAAQVELAAT